MLAGSAAQSESDLLVYFFFEGGGSVFVVTSVGTGDSVFEGGELWIDCFLLLRIWDFDSFALIFGPFALNRFIFS